MSTVPSEKIATIARDRVSIAIAALGTVSIPSYDRKEFDAGISALMVARELLDLIASAPNSAPIATLEAPPLDYAVPIGTAADGGRL